MKIKVNIRISAKERIIFPPCIIYTLPPILDEFSIAVAIDYGGQAPGLPRMRESENINNDTRGKPGCQSPVVQVVVNCHL